MYNKFPWLSIMIYQFQENYISIELEDLVDLEERVLPLILLNKKMSEFLEISNSIIQHKLMKCLWMWQIYYEINN